MSILTNNPGFLAAQIYDNDPNNNPVPDSFHNEYHNGVVSYTLALAAGLPPVFSQDINGLVPGPTAADIAANRLVDANGVWVDVAGGLNQFGTGTFVQNASGGNAGGQAFIDGTISASDGGSTATGWASGDGTGTFLGTLIASANGAHARGRVNATSITSLIRSTGNGSDAYGYVFNGTIDATADGSQAGGLCVNGGVITASGDASRASGQAFLTGTIVASEAAAFAHGASDDAARNILASFRGSVAMGDAVGSTAITAAAIGAMQFGGGSNTTAHSAQFGGTLRVNWGTPGFSLFGVPVVGQQAHVADPTDLATCITAITAINLMCANYGLTAAA